LIREPWIFGSRRASSASWGPAREPGERSALQFINTAIARTF